MGKKDYYAILGVNPDATEEEVRTAYLKLALKWHPDKHANDDAAKDKFQQIGEAYHVLQDPLQRAEYDDAAEYDVCEYALEEYLRRFQVFILTVNGLGLEAAGMSPSSGVGSQDSGLGGFGGLLGVS
mmetsp:Transcript_14787/g.28461  ORF Transcript_14787/g.28461 Transcript_14787/m.28461 type:complete len:127 (-) Transcript_14787:401-781(-)|eukprot:CAMPEP_0114256618 /NCGR_PEP_ID=MMETSP0058-20121206/18266_1 /TAXON_ID=36894 /ORGANISM="Pyramimonas parkeae, CCMP726" /LENGTH=126 /DNA_ID=CAMNT_0001371231 /DNA_START=321 /DNA_END=701 /DNA_ORIENTATION=-